MIRLIQTLFAVACIMLIAGYHFNQSLLLWAGLLSLIASWILTLMVVILIKDIARNQPYSEDYKIL